MFTKILPYLLLLTPIQSMTPVITDPPVHGDYVICWDNNNQIVLSGGLCQTTMKKTVGKSTKPIVNSKVVSDLYDRIIEYRSPTLCGDFYPKYYIASTSYGCMVAVSNETLVSEIRSLLTDDWTGYTANSADTNIPKIILLILCVMCCCYK